MALSNLLYIPLLIVGVPVGIAFLLLFLAIWLLLTVTGIGPGIQYLCTRRDKKLFADALAKPALQTITSPAGYNLVVRFSGPGQRTSGSHAPAGVRESSASLVDDQYGRYIFRVSASYQTIWGTGLNLEKFVMFSSDVL